MANGSNYFAAGLNDGTYYNTSAGTVVAGAGVPSDVTPEPSTLVLSGTGLLILVSFVRRRGTAAPNLAA